MAECLQGEFGEQMSVIDRSAGKVEHIEAFSRIGIGVEGYIPTVYGQTLGEFVTARGCAVPGCPTVAEVFNAGTVEGTDEPILEISMWRWENCAESASPVDQIKRALEVIKPHGFEPK